MTLKEWMRTRAISRSDLAVAMRVSGRSVEKWQARVVSPRLEEAIKIYEITEGAVGYAEMTAVPRKLRRWLASEQAAQ